MPAASPPPWSPRPWWLQRIPPAPPSNATRCRPRRTCPRCRPAPPSPACTYAAARGGRGPLATHLATTTLMTGRGLTLRRRKPSLPGWRALTSPPPSPRKRSTPPTSPPSHRRSSPSRPIHLRAARLTSPPPPCASPRRPHVASFADGRPLPRPARRPLPPARPLTRCGLAAWSVAPRVAASGHQPRTASCSFAASTLPVPPPLVAAALAAPLAAIQRPRPSPPILSPRSRAPMTASPGRSSPSSPPPPSLPRPLLSSPLCSACGVCAKPAAAMPPLSSSEPGASSTPCIPRLPCHPSPPSPRPARPRRCRRRRYLRSQPLLPPHRP